jgi:hypothetical protein
MAEDRAPQAPVRLALRDEIEASCNGILREQKRTAVNAAEGRNRAKTGRRSAVIGAATV